MNFNKAIVVSMPVIYRFLVKLPQDYGLKIIYCYSQQFEYSLQSTYWNSVAVVMYSKKGLREEIGWCRRGWCSRSGLLQEQVGSLHILFSPPSLLSMFSDPVTPSYNAKSRTANSVLWTWTPRLPELISIWMTQSLVFHQGSRMQIRYDIS